MNSIHAISHARQIHKQLKKKEQQDEKAKKKETKGKSVVKVLEKTQRERLQSFDFDEPTLNPIRVNH